MSVLLQSHQPVIPAVAACLLQLVYHVQRFKYPRDPMGEGSGIQGRIWMGLLTTHRRSRRRSGTNHGPNRLHLPYPTLFAHDLYPLDHRTRLDTHYTLPTLTRLSPPQRSDHCGEKERDVTKESPQLTVELCHLCSFFFPPSPPAPSSEFVTSEYCILSLQMVYFYNGIILSINEV